MTLDDDSHSGVTKAGQRSGHLPHMRTSAYIAGMGAGHDHSHRSDTRVSRMLIAAAILTAFFVLELVTALTINSIALLADAATCSPTWSPCSWA